MTVCCSKSPVRIRPGSVSSPSRTLTAGNYKRFRSTKGASKARRDLINAEIRNMRALLPIPEEEQERLSYLHSMAVICTFIRKSVLLKPGMCSSDEGLMPPYEDLLQILPGFIIAMTKEGKLVYVSENVSQYLGFSMVDVLQSDTFFDMIDNYDVDAVKSVLEDDIATERSFMCRMFTSKAFRLLHGTSCPLLVRGHYQEGPQGHLFVALCTPTLTRRRGSDVLSSSVHFQSLHRADMSYTLAQDSVVFHLGYEAEELIGRSWYSMLHPDDLTLSASGHKLLMQQGGDGHVDLVLRVQAKDLTWVWLYVQIAMNIQSLEITCTNYVISETEAVYLRQKVSSTASFSPYLSPSQSHVPSSPQPSSSPKRRAEGVAQNEEQRRKCRRLSEPATPPSISVSPSGDQADSSLSMADHQMFYSTPPYSPASSLSSAQEDSGMDVFQEVYGHREWLLSPPFCPALNSSPQALQPLPSQVFTFSMEPHPFPNSSYSYPQCEVEGNIDSEFQLVESSPNCAFSLEEFSLPLLPADVSEVSSSTVLLTPDASPTDPSYSEREQAEISILAHQISSLASSFDMYRTQSCVRQLSHAPCWPSVMLPNPDALLDEEVIDSILKNWDGVRQKKEASCIWGSAPRDLPEVGDDPQVLSVDHLVVTPPLELSSTERLSVSSSRCHADNVELHQLSPYVHTNFQQDGFFDESMY